MLFLHFGHLGGVPFTILSQTAAAKSGFLVASCGVDLSLYLINTCNITSGKDNRKLLEMKDLTLLLKLTVIDPRELRL